jgi:hypothetical protein
MTTDATTESSSQRLTESTAVAQKITPPRRHRSGTTKRGQLTATDTNPKLTTVSGQVPSAPQSHRLMSLMGRRPGTVTFQRLEQREGVVLEVEGEVFRARLVDPSGREPDEEVEIEMEQLSNSDLHLVVPGGLFFWAIGYVTKSNGRRNLTLRIEFRRFPKVHPGFEKRARAAASEYMEAMDWT